MSEPAQQTQRPYRPEISRLWWLRRRSYVFFVLRELSSIFVAWSVVFLLLLVRALAQGEAQFRAFLDWAAGPWVVALDVLTLAFLVLHAVTWFNLTPAATVVKLRGRRVPPRAIAGGAYAAWVAVTALVVVLVVTR
ncbi:fumarate reductase subunit C [Terrabacter sp. MAHUQ-38]|jgi:fumarate reductase subunit C|uniref:fumarate reductase subunit C n=1 Tax=unclassified Terrabacter TaxID=2630222 RepID=UPI00165D9C9B|nr:fumarate reductase subunit C [Terrabacter sp. MAHUQ-38]MBC9822379.1 fumarate reductase subunit C [Terrabacter sp. MAHUQ-38]